jgi:hypothetical protein
MTISTDIEVNTILAYLIISKYGLPQFKAIFENGCAS